jgi:hypothetical protein
MKLILLITLCNNIGKKCFCCFNFFSSSRMKHFINLGRVWFRKHTVYKRRTHLKKQRKGLNYTHHVSQPHFQGQRPFCFRWRFNVEVLTPFRIKILAETGSPLFPVIV